MKNWKEIKRVDPQEVLNRFLKLQEQSIIDEIQLRRQFLEFYETLEIDKE